MELKKYNEKKIFVTGVSGSGKTTFAIKYSEQFQIPYIGFDLTWKYENSTPEIEYDKMMVRYNENQEFITDAIPYTYFNGKLKILNYYDQYKDEILIVCTCCTDKDEFERRIESKLFRNKLQAYREFHEFYFESLKEVYSKLNIVYFDSFKNEFITEKEIFERLEWLDVYIKEIELEYRNNLKEHIDKQIYDKLYGDIECINLIGYSQSSKTWENIKNLVDWKGKKVADLGCFHCYFSFKIAKEGGIVTGFDVNELVLGTSKLINEIEGNIITLKKWAGGEVIPADFDVALCLNVIHHFADLKLSLQNIKAKTVIFETNKDLVDAITEEFKITKEVKSHRVDFKGNERIILLCEKIVPNENFD